MERNKVTRHNTDIAACDYDKCSQKETCLRWQLGHKQRLKSQGGVENTPIVNMCLTAFRQGVENVLEELSLKPESKEVTCTQEIEVGNGNIKALVTEKLDSTNTSADDDVRRRSTIQVLEYARSLDTYNQFGKADIDKNIAWLKNNADKYTDTGCGVPFLYIGIMINDFKKAMEL